VPSTDSDNPEPEPDPARDRDAVEVFNRGCRCITLDAAALHGALEVDLVAAGLPRPLLESHPHLFAELPVFLSRNHVARMQAIIRSVEAVAGLGSYLDRVSTWAPAIARFEPGALGVFFGYDFHLAAERSPGGGVGSPDGEPVGPQLMRVGRIVRPGSAGRLGLEEVR
jgi:hypothetical protein